MKHVLLAGLFATTIQATAQPTLTASGNLPTAGLNVTIQTGSMVNVGVAGANQLWDYSTFASTGVATGSYAACPATAGCGSFPGATLVVTDGNGLKIYYKTSSTAMANAGYVTPAAPIVYSDVDDALRFPFSYGNAYVDPFVANFTTNGIAVKRFGTDSVTADAWGKLITPFGTYNNVLRVKQVQTYRDSFAVGSITMQYKATNYYWYQASSKYPIFYTATLMTTTNGSTPSGTQIAGYYKQTPAGINDLAAGDGLRIAPNPARGDVRIELPAGVGRAALTVTSATGAVVYQQTIGGGQHTVPAEGWARGLYFVQLRSEAGAQSAKLVLE